MARHNRKRSTELLIAEGAFVDVNAETDDGKTPLDVAIEFKHTETIDLLRKYGGKTGEELKARNPQEKKESLLTKCKTCNGKISREAITCPHCGQPNPVN